MAQVRWVLVPETQGHYTCQAVCSSICHTITLSLNDWEGSWAGLCQCGSFVMFCAPNAKILTKYPKNPTLRKIRFVEIVTVAVRGRLYRT